MAQLQPSYEDSKDIPEGYESAFQEKEGKYVFVGGEFDFKTEADLSDMRTKKQAAFDELHALKGKVKGIDIENYSSLVDELDTLRATKTKGGDEEAIRAIVDVKVNRATEKLTSENTSLLAENQELKDFKGKTEKSKAINKILKQYVSKDAFEDAKFIINSAISKEADGTYISNGQVGFEKGLSVKDTILKAIESRPTWKRKSTEGHGGEGSGNPSGLTKTQQLNKLLAKRQKGEKLTLTEEKEMNVLAREIKAERQGT